MPDRAPCYESRWLWLRGFCTPAAPLWAFNLNRRCCSGTAMQAPHSRYPSQPRGAGLPTLSCRHVSHEDGGNRSLLAVVSRHGGGRDRSPVTLWASLVLLVGHPHRRSPLVVPGADATASALAFVLLPSHGQHVIHRKTPMIPALCASTDGTRRTPHRGWGVCACTLRQRPVGRRLRKPGIASFVRPASNGAYLVRPHVLLHPIRRQEPHPLPYHHDSLCQGFRDRWDRCDDT